MVARQAATWLLLASPPSTGHPPSTRGPRGVLHHGRYRPITARCSPLCLIDAAAMFMSSVRCSKPDRAYPPPAVRFRGCAPQYSVTSVSTPRLCSSTPLPTTGLLQAASAFGIALWGMLMLSRVPSSLHPPECLSCHRVLSTVDLMAIAVEMKQSRCRQPRRDCQPACCSRRLLNCDCLLFGPPREPGSLRLGRPDQ